MFLKIANNPGEKQMLQSGKNKPSASSPLFPGLSQRFSEAVLIGRSALINVRGFHGLSSRAKPFKIDSAGIEVEGSSKEVWAKWASEANSDGEGL